MSILEANIALISALPEADQEKVFLYLSENYFENNPYRPMSAKDISEELAEARRCFDNGDFQDFDAAIDEISLKYDL